MRNSITNMIAAIISSIRYMMRRAIITYQFYNPEIRMGGCVVRYARQNYPELMVAPMTPENFYNVARSMLSSVSGYFTEMITDNRVDVQAERQRIGSKIADITTSELDDFKTPALQIAQDHQQYFGTPIPPGSVTSPVFVTPAPHQQQYQQGRENQLIHTQKHQQQDQAQSQQLLHKKLQHPEPKYSQSQQQHLPSTTSSFNPLSSLTMLPQQFQQHQQFPPRYRNIRRSAAGNILAYDDNDYIDTPSQSRSFAISLSRSINMPFTFNEHRFLSTVSSNRRRSVGGTLMTTSTSSDNLNYDGPWAAGDNQSSASNIVTATQTATAVTENANFPVPKTFSENNLNVKQSNKKENEELSVAYVGPRQFTAADTMLPLPPPPTAPPQYVRLDAGQNRLPSQPQSQLQPPTTAALNFKVGHNDNDISNVDIDDEEGVVMPAENDDNAKNGNTIDGENSTSSSGNTVSGGGGGGIEGTLANLFDFENIISESLGLTAKEVKSSSLTRCTQSYILHIMWRSLETLLKRAH